jgi:MFS family permease
VVCAAIVLVPITATGASVALPDVSASLSSSLSAAQWVVNAFFLTFASFMAVSGSLADLTGRRRMFAGGVGLFCVAMLVATFSPDIGLLIAARVIAGIGAAAAVTSGSALVAQAYEGPARIRAFGVYGTAIGLGLAFGPLVAGVLTSLGGWRVFFGVAAVVVAPVLALFPLLRESRDPHPAGPDWLGAATFTLGLLLFVFALIEGPSLGWASPVVLAALAAFLVLLAAFVAIERRCERPMIDVSLFTEPSFAAICLMPVLLGFGFVAPLMELPDYFAAVDGTGPEAAGLILVLLTGPTLVAPAIVTRVAPRVSRRTLLVLIMACQAAGTAWLTVIRPHAGIAELAGPMLLTGCGFGISLAILDGAAVSSVEPARAGMASGVFNTVRLTGESIAIAVLGALLAAVTEARLTGTLGGDTAHAVTAQLLQGDMTAAVRAVPGTSAGGAASAAAAAAGGAYTSALRVGLWGIAGLSALGGIAAGLLARETRPSPETEPSAGIDPAGETGPEGETGTGDGITSGQGLTCAEGSARGNIVLRPLGQACPWATGLAAGRRGICGAAPGVGGQPAEQAIELIQLGVIQAGAQPRVEGDRRVSQPQERGVPRFGQLDDRDPPVGRAPRAGNEPLRLHRVEVMGQRGLTDAHRRGEFALVPGRAGLQVEQDQPHGQRAARRREGLVEGPLHRPGRLVQAQASGYASRFRHARHGITFHRLQNI